MDTKTSALYLTWDLGYLHDNAEMLDREDIIAQLAGLYREAGRLAEALGADPSEIYQDEEATIA